MTFHEARRHSLGALQLMEAAAGRVEAERLLALSNVMMAALVGASNTVGDGGKALRRVQRALTEKT